MNEAEQPGNRTWIAEYNFCDDIFHTSGTPHTQCKKKAQFVAIYLVSDSVVLFFSYCFYPFSFSIFTNLSNKIMAKIQYITTKTYTVKKFVLHFFVGECISACVSNRTDLNILKRRSLWKYSSEEPSTNLIYFPK